MLLRVLAAAALLALLWWVFRLSMGLRWSKIEREAARRQEEETGRRVIAELPLPEGVVFFVADAAALHWGGESVARIATSASRWERLSARLLTTRSSRISGHFARKRAKTGVSKWMSNESLVVTRNSPAGVISWPASLRVKPVMSSSRRLATATISSPAGVSA